MSRGKVPAIISSMMSLESDDTPMHIGVLLRFQIPANASSTFMADLAADFRRQSDVVFPWNSRLLSRWVIKTQWQECQSVDLSHHFRQIGLPAPGGERELGVLVSRLHSQLLDMERPPWECFLIEGLEGNGFALYIKVHRALLDVAGGAEVLYTFLAQSKGDSEVTPPWHCCIDADSINDVPQIEAWEDPVAAATGLGKAITRLVGAGIRRDRTLAVPYRAPRTALNGPVNRQRRFATQRYDQKTVSELTRKLGGCDDTVTLLYLCGSALRRFLKEFNALPDEPLVAAVPQSRVYLSDFSLAFVSLASDEADPLARYAAVDKSYRAALAHLADVAPELRMAYSLAASAPFIASQAAGAQPWMPAMFNLSFINMPGPIGKRYLAGAELVALHNLSLLMPGTALAVTSNYYDDAVSIGLIGARDTLPHLQRVAVYMGLALEQLEASI